ncbi:YqjD family protein [Pseudorhodoferax sp. Leaf274]|uniref:DUF883 family protein n=1 Tax=Pseudorhodoferax sp. Leaf274 TaxID=1736318 RepID=UPI0007027F49|nr:hypothetical protein [Pseudorhodoferax sp. Leaf274]KQP35609.1 hypothetical protein ASF44_20005 [Pseudorhodoferax sp. Leaf274]
MHNDTPAFAPTLDTGKLQRGVQEVGENLHSTIDRVAQPVHQVVERASAGAHQTVDRMANGVAEAAQRLDAKIDRVRATPNQALEGAREYVAARPLKTVAAALALGWLIGRIGAYR